MHKPDHDRILQKTVTIGLPRDEAQAKPKIFADKPKESEQNSLNDKQVAQSIPNLVQAFQNQQEEIRKINLPAKPTKYREEFEKIEKARRNLHTVVENYFRILSDSYISLILKNPSAELASILNERVEGNLKSLEYYRSATEKGSLSQVDIDFFNDKDFHKSVTDTERVIRSLQEQSAGGEREISFNKEEAGAPAFSFPTVAVNEKVLESVFRNLTDYVSTACQPEEEELSISAGDYFQNEERVLAVVNEHHKTISLFNLNAPRVVTLALKNQNEIPYAHSLIVTPESFIFLSGGLFMSSGNITNACFSFNTSTVSLDTLAPMIVKRVGHTLAYAKKQGAEGEGEIYAIGGRVDQTVRTKLCERFIISEGKWQRIANLNEARSRAALANFDNKFLYAFFGTDSSNHNVYSIERYSIELDHWELIKFADVLPGLEVTFAAACQINSTQILVFGGFSESDHFPDLPTPNHRVATFNVLHESFNVSKNLKLPMDFSISNSSTAMVIGGGIYCIGHFFESTQPELRRALDCDYVLRIGRKSAEVKSLMLSDKAYARVDKTQRPPVQAAKKEEEKS